MRDFIKQLADLPKYKWINIFMMICLCVLASMMRKNYLIYVTDQVEKPSSTFYITHVIIYSALTLVCIIVLFVNKIRGRNLWTFACILYFDGLMFWPWIQGDAADMVSFSNFSLQIMVGLVLTYLFFSELVNIRHIRLGVKLPDCWTAAMRCVLFCYLIETTYILSLYY